MLGFHPAPILLGFVLGPRVEENFRRAMLISRGDLLTFVERPISAFFVALAVLLIGVQIVVWLRGKKGGGSFGVEIPLGASADVVECNCMGIDEGRKPQAARTALGRFKLRVKSQ